MLARIKDLVFTGYLEQIEGIKFILKETATQATVREAKFEAEHEDYIVFKFDKTPKRDGVSIKPLFSFYSDGKAQAMCDYIIFYKKNNTAVFAVICNLKSSNKSNNPSQIKAGEIFAKFILDTAKRVYPNDFDSVNIHYRSVLFHDIKGLVNNVNYRDKAKINNKNKTIYRKKGEIFRFKDWCHI